MLLFFPRTNVYQSYLIIYQIEQQGFNRLFIDFLKTQFWHKFSLNRYITSKRLTLTTSKLDILNQNGLNQHKAQAVFISSDDHFKGM